MMSISQQQRRGFTIVEVTVVIMLTTFLAVMLSSAWVGLSRPAVEIAAWGQLFQEMDVAVASLARDLGGSQPDYKDSDNLPGDKRQGVLLACRAANDALGNHLQLCFDGGTSPDGATGWDAPTDDTVIDYYVDSASGSLLRLNQKTNTTFTVAKNVTGITVASYDATHLQVDLSFSFTIKGTGKTLSRQCTLYVKKNP